MIRTTLTLRMPTLRWVGTLHPPLTEILLEAV